MTEQGKEVTIIMQTIIFLRQKLMGISMFIYTAVILASYSHIYLACLDIRCQVEVAKLVKTTGLYIPYYRITLEKKKTCVRTTCNVFFRFYQAGIFRDNGRNKESCQEF